MKPHELVSRLRELPRIGADVAVASTSAVYAARRGLVGRQWASFGRQVALRAAGSMPRSALALWLTPVNCFRYFEFDFVERHMPPKWSRLLDVSSPRLFPLRMASEHPGASLLAINPDRSDLEYTRKLADLLRLRNLQTEAVVVEQLDASARDFDVVTSISVIEHIAGQTGDIDAIRSLYGRVRPGGRLLLTVPVDRAYRLEYRGQAQYEVATDEKDGMYFFSRIYDAESIRSRLLAQCPGAAIELQWYGERTAGLWRSYERRWLREGARVTIDDARMMARDYQVFPSFDSMPGEGACGIAILKPHDAA